MQPSSASFDALVTQLAQLSDQLVELQRLVASLCQETVWDAAVLRQAVATKQDLLGLATREELKRSVDQLRQDLASHRFESHQEHQELCRRQHDSPYAWDPPAPPRAVARVGRANEAATVR